MKDMYFKKIFCFILILLSMIMVLGGCNNKNDDSNDDSNKSLPQEISQSNWNSKREYIELSTGITMSYVEMGNKDGKVMILQHGTTDNSRIWSLAAPYLCKAGYHLYLTDLRGQGYSSQPDGFYTLNDYATDLKAFMDAKNIDKAIMVGQSLGSFVMQAFMIMYPKRCEKVVLVASGVANETYAKSSASAYAYFNTLDDNDHPSDTFMNSWYVNECEVDKEFMDYIVKESQALPIKVWKNIFGGASMSNLMEMYKYADSSIPTLIMHGTKDSMLDETHQNKLKEQLPFAEYMEYAGVGHNIHIEIPEKFSSDLITWLSK